MIVKQNIQIKIIVSIFILLFLAGCVSNDRELGDNYYYLPKYESIDIGYPNCEAIIYKSKQEYLFSDIKISGDVIDLDYNDKFIIALRKPINSEGSPLEYYIIIKEIDDLLGPMDIKTFESKKIELKINLKIR